MGVQFHERNRNTSRRLRPSWVAFWILGWSLIVFPESRTKSEVPSKYLSAEEQLGVPDSELDYSVAALVLTRDFVPNYNIGDGLRSLDVLADRVRTLLQRQPDGDEPEVRIAAINTVLFHEYNFGYDFADFPKQTSDKRLLGNLLLRGQGTCANLPDLYYAVAERIPSLRTSGWEAHQHRSHRARWRDVR